MSNLKSLIGMTPPSGRIQLMPVQENKLQTLSNIPSTPSSDGKFVWVASDDSSNGTPIPLPATPPLLLRTSRTLAKPERKQLITKGPRKGQYSGVVARLPPPFDATTRVGIHRRFRANGTMTSTTVSLAGLLGSLGVVGTVVNTTVASVFSSVKIDRIVMWPPQNTGPDRTILEWGASADGGYVPDSAFVNTIPDGITETNGYSFRPPSKSLLNNWMSTYLSASNIIAYVSCPTGTIIDIHVTACQPNDFVPENISVTAAAIGSFYYLALDGPSTNIAIPVGLATTH